MDKRKIMHILKGIDDIWTSRRFVCVFQTDNLVNLWSLVPILYCKFSYKNEHDNNNEV